MSPETESVEDLATAVVGSIAEPSASGRPGESSRTDAAGDRTRPSLLVTPDTYSELRARATDDPWRSWAARAREFLQVELGAIEPVGAASGDETVGFYASNRSVFEHASAASLLSILDPSNREEYAERLAAAIDLYHEEIRPQLADGWSTTVYPSGVFFTLVLGLDVVGSALPEATRRAAEEKLADVADWYWDHRDGAWPSARFGAYGVWAAYAGDRDRLRTATEELLSLYRDDFNDGPYQDGCAYAQGRFLGTFPRNAKSHFLDVLAAASGVDLHGVAFVSRGHDWMFGYARTPIVSGGDEPNAWEQAALHPGRDNYTFGDTRLQYHVTSFQAATYRAGKFDARTENHAAWALLGENPDAARNAGISVPESYAPPNRNVFLAYVLTESVPTDPDPIPSRIFDAGGAWFLQNSHDTESLAAACWNSTTAGGHSHRDTNAVHCCAYGEHVLRNVGYNGYGSGQGPFDWEYVHDRAVGNNVAMLNYEFADDAAPPAGAHEGKAGAGVREGFVDGPVGYASCDSGDALAGGRHRRNMVYVPPDEGTLGYWLLFDELAFEDAEPETVHTALHPNSAAAPTIEGSDFAATTPVGGPHPRSENDVSLTIAYGTEPDRLQVRDGALASTKSAGSTPLKRVGEHEAGDAYAGSEEGFVGKYLYATYDADRRDNQLATALVPHDAAREKPSLSRLLDSGVSGIELGHGSVTDRAVEISAGDPVSLGDARVAGAAAFDRRRPDGPGTYFVRRGTEFSRNGVGFEAEEPVSVAVAGRSGSLTAAADTVVRFDHERVTDARIDGRSARVLESGAGYVEVRIPAGRHEISLR